MSVPVTRLRRLARRLGRLGGPVLAPFLLVALLGGAREAHARPISELTRILGEHENELIGLGIVIGLDGTGDDAESARAAARPFRELLKNLGNPVESPGDIGEGGAFAIVQVSMTIPAGGASEGTRLMVHVDTLFDATDLAGGRLVPSLLRVPVPDRRDLAPLAIASGALQVSASNPTSGRIHDGGMMIADVRPQLVSPEGLLTLVLEPSIAGHANAQAIADAINEPDGFGDVAVRIARVDETGRLVRVSLPMADRSDPAGFIADVQSIEIDPSLLREVARVVIDRTAGTIVATSSVTVRPVAVALREAGLRLDPALDVPGPWRAVDGGGGEDRASARLNDLLAHLDQIRVPVDQQIDLIRSLARAGAITAEIVEQ